MYNVVCDESNNPPEVIERNELWATIAIVPHRFANDESFLAWNDPEVWRTKQWVMNGHGEVELVGEC